MYNYIGILSKSSAISNVFTANLTSSQNKLNLVISKGNTIEIFNINKDGLENTPSINLYANISILEKLSLENTTTNSLFVVTDDLDYLIINYNKSTENFIVKDKGSIKEDIGRRLAKIHFSLDSQNGFNNYVVVSAYKNVFKVIDLKTNKTMSIRYDFDDILSLKRMSGISNDKVIFGIMKTMNFYDHNTSNSQEYKISVIFETFIINLNTQSIISGDWSMNLTSTPNFSLVITPKRGGIIIFYSNVLRYYANKATQSSCSVTYSERKFTAFTEVDEQRYLVGDMNGNLFLLAFMEANNNIKKLEIIFQFLGELTNINSICYLDNNFVYIGSNTANSQLIKILKNVDSKNPRRPLVEVIEEFECLAPISDFTLMNYNNSNTEILCVSGLNKKCSLKVIRKGITANIEGEISMSGVKSIYSFVSEEVQDMVDITDEKLTYILISKVDRSELFSFYPVSFKIEKLKSQNDLILNERTLYIGVKNKQIIQVTNNHINIYSPCFKLLNQLNTIVKPILVKIKENTCYIFNKNNILASYNFGKIKENNNINNENITDIILNETNISCFEVSEDLLFYSCWNSNQIMFCDLKKKNFESIYEIKNEKIFANSIAILKNEGLKYLFVSLSDGKILYFKIKYLYKGTVYSAQDIIFQRTMSVSKEIFELKKVKINNISNIFINSELPQLLSIKHEAPILTTFNIKDCDNISNIKSSNNTNKELYSFIFEDRVIIGSISKQQTQTISSKIFEKQIYQMIHIQENSLIALICEDDSLFSLRLIDKNLNEIANIDLEHKESCITFAVLKSDKLFDKDKIVFALGVAIIENAHEEPTSGKIVLVEYNTNNCNFKRLSELDIIGGVYKIATINEYIVAGVGGSVHIYLTTRNPEKLDHELDFKCVVKHKDFNAITEIICYDNLVLVADIYRSVVIYKFDETKDKLTETCRDFSPILITALSQVENNYYLVADADCNVYCMKKDIFFRSDEEKYKLERVSQINLGERITKIVNVKKKIDKDIGNSLEPTNMFKENDKDYINLTYFTTFVGSIGVMININQKIYEFLSHLQTEIQKTLSINKNSSLNLSLDYQKWRAVKDGYNVDFYKNFLDGEILEEFLKMSLQSQSDLMNRLNYPWKYNISDVISILEALQKYH